MSDQTPVEPTPPGSTPAEPTPYGSPPPPPASNPYATPPAPPPVQAPPPATPVNPYATPSAATPPAPPPPATYGTPPPPPGYAAPTYAAPGYPAGQVRPGAGGLAITALVFSIIAALTSWIPFVSILALLLALAALVMGIIAWSKAGKSHRPKGMAIAATIVSILALLVSAAMTTLVFWLGDVFVNCTDPNLTQNQQERCIENGVNDKFGIQS
ncbi:MAG TPA: hypothetical protein VMT88_13010 [Actinomycetes bacterium]|nr:hypothetical protein [Actinomycetes bacterium]